MIETSVGKNVIAFKWSDEFPTMRGNTLRIRYDVDVSATPRHVANFMFGLIMGDGNGVYFKVDDATRPAYEAAGSRPFQPYDEGPSMSYFEVPPEVLEDDERLAEWAREAFGVAQAAKRKRPARKKGAKKAAKRTTSTRTRKA